MPPPQSPNPFARSSPWGNQPSTRISLARRPAASRPPEPPARKSEPVSPAILSGFSVPPPRPRPAADAAPIAPPDAFLFEAARPPEALVFEPEARVVETPMVPFEPVSTRPVGRRRASLAPGQVVVGGVAILAVAALGVGALTLSGRQPPAAPSKPASPDIAAPAPTVPPRPAPTVSETGPPPKAVAPGAPRPPVAVRKASGLHAAITLREPPPPATAPPQSEAPPLLALPPASAPAPVAVVRPPADPEAPIPTRSRTPD